MLAGAHDGLYWLRGTGGREWNCPLEEQRNGGPMQKGTAVDITLTVGF